MGYLAIVTSRPGFPRTIIKRNRSSVFWSEGVLKLFSQRMTELLKQLMSIEGGCRTALATKGLLTIRPDKCPPFIHK